ncbi:MAG TPA: phosphoglycerate dehydrogenase [Verrucomicrobiae bacterium]|nr:phosphoglycerate dehydrogenase [Verrucomicrobiae bacterium]
MAEETRVLITDEVSDRCVDRFRAEKGLTVDYRPGLAADALREAIGACAALVVRSQTKVTAPILAAGKKLRVIGRAGTGVDNVDVEAATRAGIVVMNVPGGNTISAAEHTLSLLLALARQIPQADASVKAGRWERGKFVGTELHGKTIGIVGVGKVGREVARRARSFGMEVVGYDPFLPEELMEKSRIRFVHLDELFKRSDFITVHTPLTPQTRYLVGAKELATCKPGMRLVNCARGGIVDERAVADALREGRIGGAAFDVYEQEPPKDLPFAGMANVICTPHLAASTEEAQERVAVDIAEQICEYLRDGVARNAVNLTTLDAKTQKLAGPFLSLAAKMGRLHAQLMSGNPREIVVEYGGEIPQEATGPLSVAILRGFLESHLSNPVNAVNASFIAKERGIKLREIRTPEAVDYTSLVTVTVESAESKLTISGTLFGRNLARIVRLDGYHFDALPEGSLVLVSNDDRPGIIGLLGTTLGRNNINIANMSVGRDRTGGRAIAILNVDSEVPQGVLDEIRSAPGIVWVKTASL